MHDNMMLKIMVHEDFLKSDAISMKDKSKRNKEIFDAFALMPEEEFKANPLYQRILDSISTWEGVMTVTGAYETISAGEDFLERCDNNSLFKDETFGAMSFMRLTVSPYEPNLENVIFQNCVFNGIEIGMFCMKNVTFNNCRFESVKVSSCPLFMQDCTFRNCHFEFLKYPILKNLGDDYEEYYFKDCELIDNTINNFVLKHYRAGRCQNK